MYTNKVKKIAAVHDLSGAGRVSLTVVIPILSSMGFQVCPLPTAVLSSHTQYPHFSFWTSRTRCPRLSVNGNNLAYNSMLFIRATWDLPARYKSYPGSLMISASPTAWS